MGWVKTQSEASARVLNVAVLLRPTAALCMAKEADTRAADLAAGVASVG